MGCKERTFKNKLSYPHRCGKRIFDNSHIISAGNGIYIRFRSGYFIFAYILKRAKAQKKNPWKEEIFTDTRDYQEAMARAK